MSGDFIAFVIICICAVIIALFMAWDLATYEPIKPTWLIKKELEEKDRKKMDVFINNGNGYQPIKRADKMDIEIKPPETGSNVEPAPAKSVNAPIDNSVEQSIFRAGFFIGINLEEIKKEYGIEDEGVKSKKFFFKKKAHTAVERRKNKVIPASWAVEQQK